MKRFSIVHDTYTKGFDEVVSLDILLPIAPQLKRRYINYVSLIETDSLDIKRTIYHNSSLYINFGWSFESIDQYEEMMEECVNYTKDNSFNSNLMISDYRCDWLGFTSFNVFDKTIYDDLDIHALIKFNNDLIIFQLDVVKFISTHKNFLEHSLIKDPRYRYKIFNDQRHNKIILEEHYHSYIKAHKNALYISHIPKDIVQEQIGCHFLHYPDLFFELLEFSILKGDVHDYRD